MDSIVSFPVRGPYGNARYPGNCSGHLIRQLIKHYGATSVADPCQGSGTTGDVCREMNVCYHGFDLATGFDLGAKPLIAVLEGEVDFVFFHPPYYRIVRYSGTVWGKQPFPADLSHEDNWDRYLKRLHGMIEHCLTALKSGGQLAILIGDVRYRGGYYSAQAFIHHWYGPDRIDAVIIKAQHNVRSSAVEYRQRLIRILHETCIVITPRGKRRG